MTADGSNPTQAGEGGDRSTPDLWTALSNLEQKLDARFETVITSLQRVMAQICIDDTNLQRDPPNLLYGDEMKCEPFPPSGLSTTEELGSRWRPADLYALEGHLDVREPLALLDSDEEDDYRHRDQQGLRSDYRHRGLR